MRHFITITMILVGVLSLIDMHSSSPLAEASKPGLPQKQELEGDLVASLHDGNGAMRTLISPSEEVLKKFRVPRKYDPKDPYPSGSFVDFVHLSNPKRKDYVTPTRSLGLPGHGVVKHFAFTVHKDLELPEYIEFHIEEMNGSRTFRTIARRLPENPKSNTARVANSHAEVFRAEVVLPWPDTETDYLIYDRAKNARILAIASTLLGSNFMQIAPIAGAERKVSAFLPDGKAAKGAYILDKSRVVGRTDAKGHAKIRLYNSDQKTLKQQAWRFKVYLPGYVPVQFDYTIVQYLHDKGPPRSGSIGQGKRNPVDKDPTKGESKAKLALKVFPLRFKLDPAFKNFAFRSLYSRNSYHRGDDKTKKLYQKPKWADDWYLRHRAESYPRFLPPLPKGKRKSLPLREARTYAQGRTYPFRMSSAEVGDSLAYALGAENLGQRKTWALESSTYSAMRSFTSALLLGPDDKGEYRVEVPDLAGTYLLEIKRDAMLPYHQIRRYKEDGKWKREPKKGALNQLPRFYAELQVSKENLGDPSKPATLRIVDITKEYLIFRSKEYTKAAKDWLRYYYGEKIPDKAKAYAEGEPVPEAWPKEWLE